MNFCRILSYEFDLCQFLQIVHMYNADCRTIHQGTIEPYYMKAIQLLPTDNVATLLGNAGKNDIVEVISQNNEVIAQIPALQTITFGNKIALNAIENGTRVFKSGYSIGKAIADIPKGQLVHVQNVRSERLDIPENIIEIIIKEMDIEQ